jgi:DNA replication protein DnaC
MNCLRCSHQHNFHASNYRNQMTNHRLLILDDIGASESHLLNTIPHSSTFWSLKWGVT